VWVGTVPPQGNHGLEAALGFQVATNRRANDRITQLAGSGQGDFNGGSQLVSRS